MLLRYVTYTFNCIPSATFSRITSSVRLLEGPEYSAIQGIALPPREVFSELRALSKREEISPLSYLWQRLAWRLSLGPCHGKPFQGARRGIWTEFTFPFRQATLEQRFRSVTQERSSSPNSNQSQCLHLLLQPTIRHLATKMKRKVLSLLAEKHLRQIKRSAREIRTSVWTNRTPYAIA